MGGRSGWWCRGERLFRLFVGVVCSDRGFEGRFLVVVSVMRLDLEWMLVAYLVWSKRRRLGSSVGSFLVVLVLVQFGRFYLIGGRVVSQFLVFRLVFLGG